MTIRALSLATPSLRDVATAAGVSYPSMRAYSKGERTPPADVRRRIARALRRYADRLRKSAATLEAL